MMKQTWNAADQVPFVYLIRFYRKIKISLKLLLTTAVMTIKTVKRQQYFADHFEKPTEYVVNNNNIL